MKADGRLLAAMVLASGGLVLAGCAASNATPSGGPVIATVTSTAAQAVTATDADNGHTITITHGGVLTVRLNSTYWHFGTNTSGAALRPAGTPTTSAVPLNASHCVPGQGCGTVTAVFQAVAPGTAVVTASRTSCGEARGCTGGQGVYQLTVMVG
ncbi:MAG TPA: hypothetical protein VGL06_01470 [Pseudonocardiaceae bacterium]